jgi:AcrR family transcriptional regulator
MTHNDAPHPQKRTRRDRREEILEAAARHFARHGFHGATLSAIAEAVGLTEPGLLHYFPSKVILLQSVLEYRDRKDREKYQGLTARQEASLFDSLEDLAAVNESRPGLVQLFTVMVGESIHAAHPSHDFFVQRYRSLRQGLSEALTAYFEAQDLAPAANPDQLAALLFAVMDGLQIQWLLDPEAVHLGELFTLFTDILKGYLGDQPKD